MHRIVPPVARHGNLAGSGRGNWIEAQGVLTRAQSATEDRTLYWVRVEQRPRVALRHGPCKTAPLGPAAPWQLFNLANDPHETADLAAKHPAQLTKLQRLFATEKAQDALSP